MPYKRLNGPETSSTQNVRLPFIISSLSVFVGGLVVIIAARIAKKAYIFISEYTRRRKGKNKKDAHQLYRKKQSSILWKGAFHERVQMMLSAQTFVGRVLVILVFLMSIGSLIIYIINCASPIEYFSSFPDETLPVDMGFNTFFLFYFGLRFLAADDKLKFWLELNSIVDFFTIPPVCASYYLKRNWLGFRFLRALRLLELPKILQFLKITKTSNSIKLVKLLAVFLSTWLTSAGFIHLVENSGDPWINYDNSQFLSYFDCLYLIMATMSTVGYGDVVAKTCLGRVSMIFFIIGGLVLFANFIPEIADVVGSNKKYEGSYKVVKGRKYIVVCGNITLESVTAFLRDFLPQDTGDICTEILFLGESLPSLELEAVFNCYSPYTTFFHGSALNDEDLKRVQMGSANACLILADICSSEPYTEDTSNIMRVLSIKNHCPNTRVIIQIIQSHNKAYLPNIPNWDWRIGDSIICFAELKLGFIAQSCLVPGLSTLLTSLFVRNESAKVKRKSMRHRNVLKGSAYQVMTYKLSNDFVGMSFPEVCRLCFVKLNLVLFAVEFRFGVHGNSILINPSAKIMLHRNVMGFFIAKSMAEVKRAHFYCKACHSDIDNPKLIEKCHCRSKLRRRSIGEKLKARRETLCVPDQDPVKSRSLGVFPPSSYAARSFWWNKISLRYFWGAQGHLEKGMAKEQGVENEVNTCDWLYDKILRRLHFVLCMPSCCSGATQSLQKCMHMYVLWLLAIGSCCLLLRGSASDVMGDKNSDAMLDSTGMFHWCHAVSLEKAILNPKKEATSDLHDHIVVCVFGDANTTLIGLRDFVMPLRASNFTYEELRDIVFVGSLEYLKREWGFIQNFPKLWLFQGSALSCADLKAVNIRHCAMCAILSYSSKSSTSPILVDTESILATLNIRAMQFKCSTVSEEAVGRVRTLENQSALYYKRIPIITELKSTSNAHFIDQSAGSSGSQIPEQELHLSTPFSSGAIFSDSFLDSLLSTTYCNHHVLALLQTLVTGGTSPELEEQLAEKNELSASDNSISYVAPRVRCKLALLPLWKGLAAVSLEGCFGDVFCKALDLFGILCFGLYRLIEEPNPYKNRCVIARPPNNFKMLPTDLLFCVVPFNISTTSCLSDWTEGLPPSKQPSPTDYSRAEMEVNA